MNTSINGSIKIQTEVNSLPELFHLIESIFDSGKNINKFFPVSLKSSDYINVVDDLVNRDKKYKEGIALKALAFFQYIDLNQIEDSGYVSELNDFMTELDSSYMKSLGESKYCKISNFFNEVNTSITKH